MSDLQSQLEMIARMDVEVILKKDEEYGSSWKKRGGVGAFMMLARKWDRLENSVRHPYHDEDIWNVFRTAVTDARDEGIIDDIRDLRRYLMLVETHIIGTSERHFQIYRHLCLEAVRREEQDDAAHVQTRGAVEACVDVPEGMGGEEDSDRS